MKDLEGRVAVVAGATLTECLGLPPHFIECRAEI